MSVKRGIIKTRVTIIRNPAHGGKKEKIRRDFVPAERTRLAVLRRDNYKCCLCGASPAHDENVVLHIDHIKPVSRGGKPNIMNLWTLCGKCNLEKSDFYENEMLHKATNHLALCFFKKCVTENAAGAVAEN